MTIPPNLNVLFWLKKGQARKDKTAPIYARIRIDGSYVDLSTREFILSSNWSSPTNRLKINAPNSERINTRLESINRKIKTAYQQLIDEGHVITPQAVKIRFLGKDNPVSTCKELFLYHRNFEFKKLAPGTTKNYRATEKYFSRFIKKEFNCDDISLKRINYTFITKFENFLRTCKPLQKGRPLSNNGVMKHLERMQKLMNVAYKHDWIKKNPFALYQLKFKQFNCSFLEQSEINKIASLSLLKKNLRRVRDIFIFSCYTGLAYTEIKNLRKNNLVKGVDDELWVMMRRQKSNTSVKLPLLNEAKEILDRYTNYPSSKNNYSLFPVYSNQKVNQHLKSIADIADIDIKLTFHMARHTFATTVALLNDVPIETVSKMLGHTKLSTTQRYARVIEKKISKDMGQLKAKLQKSKSKTSYKKTSYDHLRII